MARAMSSLPCATEAPLGGQVAEIKPGGAQTMLAAASDGPFALAVDGSNNVFYIEENSHNAYEIPYVGGAYSSPVLITGNTELGLAADAAGDLWVAVSTNGGQLVEFPNLGGTTVSTTPVGGIAVSYPLDVLFNGQGNVFYADGTNIRELSMAAAPAQSFPTQWPAQPRIAIH